MSKNMLKAKYSAEENPLTIGDIEIPCYVLENGQRVLSQGGMLSALGMKPGTAGGKGDRLASFVAGKRVNQFISKDLAILIEKPLQFKTKKSLVANGYDAEVLQEIVRGISKAYLQGKLQKQQAHIGERAEKLDDAFSKVGVIALIDEATGYQYEREREELQKILGAYISNELLPWQKTFPDEFYIQIFRLNQWPYTAKAISRRPQVIGHWTNSLIYKQLPPGVLAELKKKTPKSSKGNYTRKFFQSLTPDIGNPHLQNQLVSVVTLMKVSKDWRDFIKNFNKLYGQLELDFPDEEPEAQLSSFNDHLSTALKYNPKESE